MNFDQLFEPRLELIRSENRYRIFADLERCAGHFPQAFDHRLQDRVTVWCSNDYPAWANIQRCSKPCMKSSTALELAPAARGTFPGPPITTCYWKMSSPISTARRRRCS